ncbi:MAG: hypothetical protein V9G63_10025 [Candidatus Competibacter sp.]|jgi:hypothetical protein
MSALGPPDFNTDLRVERRLGRELPLAEGLELLAEYLSGLQLALLRPEPLPGVRSALSAWESYVRGLQDRVFELNEENIMNPANSLTREQRTAIISAIRTNASDRGVLERTPDDLLLAALHALTGRTGDLIRHVTAAARYSNL